MDAKDAKDAISDDRAPRTRDASRAARGVSTPGDETPQSQHTAERTRETISEAIADTAPTGADPLDSMADAIFKLLRAWPARANELPDEFAGLAQSAERSRTMFAQAVYEVLQERTSYPTVPQVADRLDIDPARASQLVADAVQAGLLRRHVSHQEGARVRLALTDAGQELGELLKRRRRAALLFLTRNWSSDDRERFAQLLARFVREINQPSA